MPTSQATEAEPVRLLAMDSFGTLFDAQGGLTRELAAAGSQAPADLAKLWIEGILQVTQQVNATGQFRPFPDLVAQSLGNLLSAHSLSLSPGTRGSLIEAWRRLPAFPGVQEALQCWRDLGAPLWIVTNGDLDGIEALLDHNNLAPLVNGIVTAEAAGKYKPAREIYEAAFSSAGALPAQAVMVSALPMDVEGAMAAGCRAAWLKREAIQPQWSKRPPDWTVDNLEELIDQLLALLPQREPGEVVF